MTSFWLPATIVLLEAALRLWGVSHYLRRLKLPAMATEGRVTCILPLTGQVPGLEALFGALSAQTLRPSRLIVTVESGEDPAVGRASACADLLPCPLEIVVAGPTERCGQKSMNLVAALARVSPDDEAVVTFDADIRPQRFWLAVLATPVLRKEADVVTGYRWPMPGGAGIAAALWTAFDRGFGMLPKPKEVGFAWGGSIAMSPAAIQAMEVPRRIGRTLTEDIVIGKAAVECRLKLVNRRAVLLATPMDGTNQSVLAFARRQFQLMHIYTPYLWAQCFAATAIGALGWLGMIYWALSGAWQALPVMAIGMAAGALRWRAHKRIAEALDIPADPPASSRLQLVFAALPPVIEFFAVALFVAAIPTRFIRWRHLDYGVDGPNDIRILARRVPNSL